MTKRKNKFRDFWKKFWYMRYPYSVGESHSELGENCSKIGLEGKKK